MKNLLEIVDFWIVEVRSEITETKRQCAVTNRICYKWISTEEARYCKNVSLPSQVIFK